jgi:hypothetical protein
MHEFDQLAGRVKQNDLCAATLMQESLELQMLPIVRRTLRRGVRDSPLSRRILAEADRLTPTADTLPAEERERRIARIARRVCASVVAKLQPQRPALVCETVAL